MAIIKTIALFSSLLLVFWTSEVSAQSLFYDIVKGSKTVGQMVVEKRMEGGKLLYKIESKTAIRIVFMVKVNYDLYESYKNGVLVEGHSKSTLNGDIQKSTTIHKYPDKYVFELESNKTTLNKKEIKYSIPEIYFSKPTGSVKVFSQVFAEYLDYEKTGANTWVLSSEDGKNISTYNEDGILELVKISRVYANFNLVLNKEKSHF